MAVNSELPVSVLVPWRPGCPHREAAWKWVAGWWAAEHPGWEVITADSGEGPWRKGAAVAAAAAAAGGRIMVVADADVIAPQVGEAVAAVAAGVPWAMPHKPVHRLTPAGTAALLAGGELPHPHFPRDGTVAHSYVGVAGGGMVVLPAATLHRVPIDPRFAGWGQEDTAWAWALGRVVGGYWRGAGPLWHLWHPPAVRRSRTVGSGEGLALYRRYRRSYTAAEVQAIIAEIPAAGCGGGD